MMIIVSGLPGSGKSYFAERLSRLLKARYINSDATRKDMEARGKYRFEDKLDVYEEMAREAGESLRRGLSVVIDATFYRREMREIFNTLATLLHERVAFIEIIADPEVIRKRLSLRKSDSEADFSVYEQLKPQYEPVREPHMILRSEDDNIDVMLNSGMDYISGVRIP